MFLGLMHKGDKVLGVTNDLVVIQRKNSEVDLIPLLKEGNSWRVDIENIITIGYGNNTVTKEDENGVVITNF